MSRQYSSLHDKDIHFISEQKVFFMASSSGKEVNLSPKGYESLVVLTPNRLLYLDWPGSGDRTARDIETGGEITLMFCEFSDSKPMILRLFSKGELIEKNNPKFDSYLSHFPKTDAKVIRRLMIFNIYAVEHSCGMSVPVMQFVYERAGVKEWAIDTAVSGELEEYIADHREPPELI